MAKKFDKWPKGAWSFSQLAALQACPRKHQLRHVLRVRPIGVTQLPLQVGTFVHTVLEHAGRIALTGTQPTDDDYQDGIKLARKECPSPEAWIEGQRLVASFRQKYGDYNAGWEGYQLIGVEEVMPARTLHQKIGGYAAIADVVVRDGYGKLWVVERKTAGRGMGNDEEEINKILRARPQLLDLAYCARDHFGELVGVCYDLLTKTKNVGLYRYWVDFSEEDLARWEADHEAMEAYVGMTCKNPNSCAPPVGFKCDYFEYCHGTDEDRAVLYKISRKR